GRLRHSADRAGRGELDAGSDPTRRRRAHRGSPGIVRAVCAAVAQGDGGQPAGVERRDDADGGGRGLLAVTTRSAAGQRRPLAYFASGLPHRAAPSRHGLAFVGVGTPAPRLLGFTTWSSRGPPVFFGRLVVDRGAPGDPRGARGPTTRVALRGRV